MKPRTVILTIELVTDVPLNKLTEKGRLEDALDREYGECIEVVVTVRQARAQVAQPAKAKR